MSEFKPTEEIVVDDEITMHRMSHDYDQAATQNKASCAVAERLEFAFEGTLHDNELLNGKYYDTNVYAKLNPLHISEQ